VPAGTLAHAEAVAPAQVNGYDIKIVKILRRVLRRGGGELTAEVGRLA
jgi:hypothetical protein